VLWTALVVVAFRGITAIISGSSRRQRAGTGAANTAGEYPVSLAEAYATEFGPGSISGFSPQSLGQREQALAAFVPPAVSAANPSLGWNGIGQLNLQSLQVAGRQGAESAARRWSTCCSHCSTASLNESWALPVAATGSGLAVTGEPAWLPARRGFRRRRSRAVRTGWPKASS